MALLKLEYTTPCPGPKGTIKLKEIPWSLGTRTDVEGKKWHIHGIFGRGEGKMGVWARPLNEVHPGFYSTGSYSDAQFQDPMQSWHPYLLEIVK